jgi:ATP-dependent DNA helicase RecQ
MADTDARRIRTILDYLADQGYLGVTGDEYPVVYLAPRSKEIFQEKKSVTMMLPGELKQPRQPLPPDGGPASGAAGAGRYARLPAAAPAPERVPLDEALLAKLRELRTSLARQIHVPPYIIFSDASLRDMCRKRPLSREAFLDVSGAGEIKLEKYGDAFIGVIREYGGAGRQPSGPPRAARVRPPPASPTLP